jgi:hypothetical protein
MKTLFFTILVALITSASLSGQDLALNKSNNVLMIRSHGPSLRSFNSPLYIITVDNRELQIPENGNLNDSITIANSLSNINPDWIQSINVLKEKDGTDKYNSLGQNGVILVELKDGTLEKIPADFSKRFKEK